jgi:lysyl-tRNA synthetase class 2
MTDTETRSRQRYVDLFMNDETRTSFRRRSAILRYLRNYFWDRDFLEVETPMMQPIPGGANARPFKTHHNALDMELFLRIAPELYLKRLVVGGLERVFEINRSFRNEGISHKHNPEFTMLEFYQAWATHEDLMDLTEELLVGLVDEVVGSRQVTFGDFEIDFSPPFRRADMDELIAEHTGLTREDCAEPAKMEAYWRANQRVGEGEQLPSSRGKWWEWLFDAYVEGKLVNPTFVTGFPTEISPLSRRRDDEPDRVDRFELIIATWEIANAFSELNDPVDQAQRFADQVAARDAGDEEGMHFDHDYIRALTYGMPPTAGEGIGIDRLVMLLTGQTNIRDVILFPTLRHEQR